jgi:regulator of sigma E protease
MSVVNLIIHNLLSFVVILTIIVFIHEFGHYYVARLCGIKVEEFSIGFGKELFGFNDKKNTRWKFCVLPFGGYVKMFGDRNPASIADGEKLKSFTAEEKKISFYFQNVYKRMAVVLAGPVANFILTILIFTAIFKIQGFTTVLPVIDKVVENSSAFEAGIKSGDIITKIDETEIKNFDQVRQIVSKNNGKSLRMEILRNNQKISVNVTPKISMSKDLFGNDVKVAMVGISTSKTEFHKLNLGAAFVKANQETYNISIEILKALGELITGKRSFKELGGPVKIAEYSGKSMNMGVIMVLWFIAMISVNLGVINLLPLPVLDGGHMFYYIIEMIRGKALPERIQQYGFAFGTVILLMLMLFTTLNDLSQILFNK